MTTPTAAELTRLIGQQMKDPKAQGVLTQIPGRGKREKNDDDIYHTYRDGGLEVVEDADSGRVATMFLHAKSRSFKEYSGELPESIGFGMTRQEVRAALGEPDKENGTREDQWDRGPYRLGVKYAAQGNIEFIYISAL